MGRFENAHSDSLLRWGPVCGTITASVLVMGRGERPARSTSKAVSVSALAALFSVADQPLKAVVDLTSDGDASGFWADSHRRLVVKVLLRGGGPRMVCRSRARASERAHAVRARRETDPEWDEGRS